MHVVVRLPTKFHDAGVLSRALAAGVGLATTRPDYVSDPPTGAYILSFAALEPATIREEIRRLAQALG
ncbi:MAG: hypothetical protein H7338_04715 [Candidatus Sericytochromatia bacterium]|nr:hypothetical protein [Candidatus Sericytochromatia bacterium]